MAKVAFLGLGNMGSGMARCLLDAGHDVSVYNRTRAKAKSLINKGAKFFETPKQAAEGADAILAMVSDDSVSRTMWMGEEGALTTKLSTETLIIECSTLSHQWVLELSKYVQSRGLRYLDCPVTGMLDAAANGELVLFLGGDQNTIDSAQPLLKPISKDQIHFGKIGNATAYKLIVNLMGSIQIAATAEAMLVAEKAQLDLGQVATALATGAAGSANVIRTSRQMADNLHEQNILFNAALRLKDTCYGVELAKTVKQETILGETTVKAFQKLVNDGYGEQSESKIIDILRS